MHAQTRPDSRSLTSSSELLRWYWLKVELVELARQRGVSTSGGKADLTARLAASLDGTPPPPATRRTQSGRQLTGQLELDTTIPRGQRCSQHLREFLAQHVGPGFRFDEHMRAFVADGEGRTLREAVQHWNDTRKLPPGEIAPQFELNRFLRAWREEHRGGSREDALEAWRQHRSMPVEARSG